MKHRIKGKKLNRNIDSRKALIKGFCKSFIENEKLVTTLPKAKYVKPEIEKLITISKNNSLNARRILLQRLDGEKEIVDKLLKEIGPRFKDRNGGYTRLYRLGIRKGDSAQMAIIEMVEMKSSREKQDGVKKKSENSKKRTLSLKSKGSNPKSKKSVKEVKE